MTVQFNHRLVAYALVLAALWHCGALPPRPRDPRAAHRRRVGAAVVVQAALGIGTLLAQVPLALGLAHQAARPPCSGSPSGTSCVRHPRLTRGLRA